LKWRYRFLEPEAETKYRGRRSDGSEGFIVSFISNIAVDGSFLVAVNLGVINLGKDEIRTDSKLMLFDNAGNVVWDISYNSPIYLPQISDDGKTVTYLVGSTSLRNPKDFHLVVCNERREVRWIYRADVSIGIDDYVLSRSGRLVALTQYDPEMKVSELVVLADGDVKWRKKAEFGRYCGVAMLYPIISIFKPTWIYWLSADRGVAMSSGGRYVVACRGFSSGFIKKKYRSVVELYSIDGDRLWSVEVDGSVGYLNVTDRGEVFFVQCSDYDKCLKNNVFDAVFKASSSFPTLIKEFKRHVSGIRLPRSGDRVVVLDNVGLHAFDTDGNHLWSLRGAVVSFDVSDEYVALTDSQRLLVASSKGEVLQRIEVGGNIREVRISPDGRYIVAASDSHVYFFENRDAILKERVKRVIAKLDELASIQLPENRF